ncbi:hypothetical protein A9262_06525 [Vibrio splendidus]|nr:hypothetical protein A9262_06525 [Vibrio splendidus]
MPLKEFIKNVNSDSEKQLTDIHKLMSEKGTLASRTIYENANSKVGVLSLTEMQDNLLMWAHYADSHTGYSIAFDTTHRFFKQEKNDLDELRHLRKVVYKEERPETTLKQLESHELLLTKSLHWKYEEEWRMVMPLSNAATSVTAPAGKVHLFKFPEAAVIEVILGANVTDEFETLVKKTISSNLKMKHVVLKKARIHDRCYKLEFDVIS